VTAALLPPLRRPAVPGRRIACAALALGGLACSAPAPDATPPQSRASAADPVPTQDTVVRSAQTDTAGLPQFDTTNYLAATEGADPDSVVRGGFLGSAVMDSVSLDDGRAALLVRLGPEERERYGYWRVYLVESAASGRAARAAELDALGTVPEGRAAFGAVDADGDGRREPYLASWWGGRGGYTITLHLLDERERFPYSYDLFGAWTYLEEREGEFLSDPAPSARARRWMAEQASRVADVVDPLARDPLVRRHHGEVVQWERDQGMDFVEGPVRVRWRPGPAPLAWGAGCRTRDGDLEWLTDGMVWGYDRARDRHFLLYRFGRYDSPHGVVPGRRYLWMGTAARTGTGRGLLAWDRASRRIRVVPVPELGRALPVTCGEPRCGGPPLSVRGGRLYGDTVRLTLPDSIVPAVEFADTGRACTAPDPERQGG
jgi:hypothetical protein